jgi:outer membrane protein OmpA-like peptidoglycan-associated protein
MRAVLLGTLLMSASSAGAQPVQAGFAVEPMMVLFESKRASLTAQSRAILDNLAAALKGRCTLANHGHGDRSGPAAGNFRLSERRARAVALYLRRRHAPAEVRLVGYGETRPLVETGDGVAELQNRRVEISGGCWPAA